MAESHDRAKTIFLNAAEIDSDEQRRAYIDAHCKGDEALRDEVAQLLQHHDSASGFLDNAAVAPGVTADSGATSVRLNEGPGSKIGRYKLLEQIGEGGFGVVFMAEQVSPVRRTVALKIIKLGMDTKQVIARFEAERQALALMDHPSVAKVLDGGATDTGRPYFVMELVKGTPITEYCDKNKLDIRRRLQLLAQVCQAVQHAHQKGLIHRDIKPSNVLVATVDDQPVVKVIDFGIAKATAARLTEKTLFTEFRQLIGTPEYMSPEQAEGGMDIDTRSDVYSLGVLLYELLAGAPPFDPKELRSKAFAEMQRIIREVEPPTPSTRLNSMQATLTSVAAQRGIEPKKLTSILHGELDWIVMRCLEKDRKRRYESANGLAMDIQRYLEGEPVVAAPPSVTYRLHKLLQRNKLAFAAASGVAAALIIGITLALWQAARVEAVLADLRATAPAFAVQSRALAAREQFDEAIEKLEYASKLRPDVPDYYIAKADLLRCQLRLGDAAIAYRAALKLRPGDTRAGAAADLCDRLLAAKSDANGKLSRESLSQLYLAMLNEQRPAAELMPLSRLLGDEKKFIVSYWLERLKDLPIPPEKPLEKRLSLREDGLLALDLSGTKISDFSHLEGMPLGSLELTSCQSLTSLQSLRAPSLKEIILNQTNIAYLTPLAGMRDLEHVELASTKVYDISPLRGKPLRTLVLRGTAVADLTPLSGTPLRELDATAIPATNFAPLSALPLEVCNFQMTRVRDLSFLRGVPLKQLILYGCVEISNLKVLSEIQTLEVLSLPKNFADLPLEEVTAIESLRSHPSLRQIAVDVMQGMNITTAQPKEAFWRDWDSAQAFALRLRRAGIDFTRTKRDDGTWEVNAGNQSLRDLSIFAGAPISALWIGGSKATDCSPLKGLPLRELSLSGSAVSDLRPLHGMRLERLHINQTPVSDLTPLVGMPLANLDLRNCDKLTDLSPLGDISTLEVISLPIQVTEVEPLRKLKKLQFLSFSNPYTRRSMGYGATAENFWKTWDGLPWARKLEAAAIGFKAEQFTDGTWDVTIDNPKFKDLSIFKNSFVRRLNVTRTSVSDLNPLKELPLEALNISNTQVTDLSPLRSPVLRDALKDVNVSRTAVSDFSPLAECPKLEALGASGTSLRDLTFVASRPLRTLRLSRTGVNDISAVAGMPLETLILDGTLVTDLTPLAKCPSLQVLSLPQDVMDLEPVRGLRELQRLSYQLDQEGMPDQTAGAFWQAVKDQTWLRKLREAGFKPKANPVMGGQWTLSLDDQAISDLSIIQGAPIRHLSIMRTKVSDLTPLRGMPLTILQISGTPVTDLSPLKGMHIELLQMADVAVSDLSPLEGMPLRHLYLTHCENVKSLEPLKNITTFQRVILPPNAKGFEFLRNLPSLAYIGYGYDTGSHLPDQKAAAFWADYDRGDHAPATKPSVKVVSTVAKQEPPWLQKLRDMGLEPKVRQYTTGQWEVNLNDQAFADLNVLKGAPIRHLSLVHTDVSDLSPLAGMPLTILQISRTKVTDLRPLKGMPLEILEMAELPISDLSPLEGMPLRFLYLTRCDKIVSLVPLKDIRTFQRVILPRNAADFDFLRGQPKLTHIGYSYDKDTHAPDKTAAQFWADNDNKGSSSAIQP